MLKRKKKIFCMLLFFLSTLFDLHMFFIYLFIYSYVSRPKNSPKVHFSKLFIFYPLYLIFTCFSCFYQKVHQSSVSIHFTFSWINEYTSAWVARVFYVFDKIHTIMIFGELKKLSFINANILIYKSGTDQELIKISLFRVN
jgi:hypothetical protein